MKLLDLKLFENDIAEGFPDIDGVDGLIQKITRAVSLGRGTWFLNLELGMDWKNIFARNTKSAFVRREVQRAIERIPEAIISSITIQISNEKIEINLSVIFEKEDVDILLTREKTSIGNEVTTVASINRTGSII